MSVLVGQGGSGGALEVLAQGGFKPEEVSEDIREKYRKYLERKKSGSGK